MALSPYENLKGFMWSRPPLVVFMICIGAFAVVLMSLAFYVKTNEVGNPDIAVDWNRFLGSLSEIQFCVTGEASDPASSVAPPEPANTPKPTPGKLTTPHILEYVGPRNYSVSLLLKVRPTVNFLSIPHNITRLSGTILGKHLGLQGLAEHETINITAEFAYNWTQTQCSNTMGCDEVQILTCVTFQGAPIVFPNSPNPPVCTGLNESGVEYNAHMEPSKPDRNSMFPVYYCRSNPVINMNHMYNEHLTVWLSTHDRSVMNLHLMHTSYFLFVMVVTLLCYAIIRGRPMHVIKYHIHVDSSNSP